MIIKNKTKKGFTVIELVIYMAGLLAIGSVLLIMTVQFYGLYREIIAVPRADRTGLILIDRITKEIRSAHSIDVIESQFDTTSGVLTLNTLENEVNIKRVFYVEDGRVMFQENDNQSVVLSSSDFIVSNFNFYFVPTDVSQSVRFNLELQYDAKDSIETKNYVGFAILRESYE